MHEAVTTHDPPPVCRALSLSSPGVVFEPVASSPGLSTPLCLPSVDLSQQSIHVVSQA